MRILTLLIFLFFAADTLALEVGDRVPNLKLHQLSDSATSMPVALDNWRGKIVLLDFWASWCGPCRISLPLLSDYNKSIDNQKVLVLAINLDEDPAKGRKFLKRYPVSYAVLSDPTGSSAQAFQLPGMPTAYLIDQQGIIRWKHSGFKASDLTEIKREVDKLLKQQP